MDEELKLDVDTDDLMELSDDEKSEQNEEEVN